MVSACLAVLIQMCFNVITFIQDHQVSHFTCSPRKGISPWAQRPSPIPPSPSQNIPLLHNPCSLKTFWLCALPKKGFRHLRHILSLFILMKLLCAQRQWIRNLSPNISKTPEGCTNQIAADVTEGIECSSIPYQGLRKIFFLIFSFTLVSYKNRCITSKRKRARMWMKAGKVVEGGREGGEEDSCVKRKMRGWRAGMLTGKLWLTCTHLARDYSWHDSMLERERYCNSVTASFSLAIWGDISNSDRLWCNSWADFNFMHISSDFRWELKWVWLNFAKPKELNKFTCLFISSLSFLYSLLFPI